MALNVLIVDDSLTARGIIRKTLGLAEFELGEVHEARDGIEALELLRKQWIDLVLADLNMPRMNGEEMIAAMQSDPLLASVPVIVVSSEGNETVLESLTERGVREVIRKPFNPGLLRESVERVLGSLST